jgi:hypothetical protein
VGFLFWPVQYWTLWLLLRVWRSPERLHPDLRGRAVLAALVALPIGVAMTVIILLPRPFVPT